MDFLKWLPHSQPDSDFSINWPPCVTSMASTVLTTIGNTPGKSAWSTCCNVSGAHVLGRNDADWEGLTKLFAETRQRFGEDFFISMAYYPDGRQERILAAKGAAEHVDLMHMMSYDQPGKHSTQAFGENSVNQGKKLLPAEKLTMGLPFYSRDVKTGQWKTYEDLVRSGPLDPSVDQVGNNYFNGQDMIERKTKFALKSGLAGVMIWESGQDHFDNDNESLAQDSLHVSISRAIAEVGKTRAKEEL